MQKCPSCGSLAQDNSSACGVCGTSLLGAESGGLDDLEKEAGAQPPGDADHHWKRKALVPWIFVYGVTGVLILSGFLLLLYSPPVPLDRRFTPYWTGFILIFLWTGFMLVFLGFMVLLYMVIGAGPSERRIGYRRTC